MSRARFQRIYNFSMNSNKPENIPSEGEGESDLEICLSLSDTNPGEDSVRKKTNTTSTLPIRMPPITRSKSRKDTERRSSSISSPSGSASKNDEASYMLPGGVDKRLLFRREARSPYWKFISLVAPSIEKRSPEYVTDIYCHECKTKVKWSSKNSTRIKNHLQRHHAEYYKSQCANGNLTLIKEECRPSEPKIIKSMWKPIKKEKQKSCSANEREALNKTIALWIAGSLRPFSLVEDAGFKYVIKYAQQLSGVYTPPSSNTIRDRVALMANEIRGNMKVDIANEVHYYCITTDFWTSRSKDSFVSLTLHYVCRKLKLKQKTLEVKHFPGEHSADAIVQALRDMLADWELSLQKCCLLVRDNGANLIRAAKNLGIQQMPCFAHTLHLVLAEALFEKPKHQKKAKKKARTGTQRQMMLPFTNEYQSQTQSQTQTTTSRRGRARIRESSAIKRNRTIMVSESPTSPDTNFMSVDDSEIGDDTDIDPLTKVPLNPSGEGDPFAEPVSDTYLKEMLHDMKTKASAGTDAFSCQRKPSTDSDIVAETSQLRSPLNPNLGNSQTEDQLQFYLKQTRDLVKKVRILSKRLNNSSRAREVLLKIQGRIIEDWRPMEGETEEDKPKMWCPTSDCITRWNSSYEMIKRILNLKNAIIDFEAHIKTSKGKKTHSNFYKNQTDFPSPSEWYKLDGLCRILAMFYDATKLMSGSLYATASLIHPMTGSIISSLEESSHEGDLLYNWLNKAGMRSKPFYDEAKDQILGIRRAFYNFFINRFGTGGLGFKPDGESSYVNESVDKCLTLAWYFDTTIVKGKKNFLKNDRNSILLRDAVLEIYLQIRDREPEPTSTVGTGVDLSSMPPPNKKVKHSAFSDLFGADDEDTYSSEGSGENARVISDIEHELNKFDKIIVKKLKERQNEGGYTPKLQEADKNEDGYRDPLKWWRSNTADGFAILKVVLRYVFCMVATSVASERCFSTAGNVITTRRSRLAPKSTRDIILINQNEFKKKDKSRTFDISFHNSK